MLPDWLSLKHFHINLALFVKSLDIPTQKYMALESTDTFTWS